MVRENKSLYIRGRTLGEHCRYGSLQTSLPRRGDFREQPLRYFYGRLKDTVAVMARRLIVTGSGHLGMAVNRARKGDVICMLYGCNIPVLLRQKGVFEFIGECYVDGFMNARRWMKMEA